MACQWDGIVRTAFGMFSHDGTRHGLWQQAAIIERDYQYQRHARQYILIYTRVLTFTRQTPKW